MRRTTIIGALLLMLIVSLVTISPSKSKEPESMINALVQGEYDHLIPADQQKFRAFLNSNKNRSLDGFTIMVIASDQQSVEAVINYKHYGENGQVLTSTSYRITADTKNNEIIHLLEITSL